MHKEKVGLNPFQESSILNQVRKHLKAHMVSGFNETEISRYLTSYCGLVTDYWLSVKKYPNLANSLSKIYTEEVVSDLDILCKRYLKTKNDMSSSFGYYDKSSTAIQTRTKEALQPLITYICGYLSVIDLLNLAADFKVLISPNNELSENLKLALNEISVNQYKLTFGSVWNNIVSAQSLSIYDEKDRELIKDLQHEQDSVVKNYYEALGVSIFPTFV